MEAPFLEAYTMAFHGCHHSSRLCWSLVFRKLDSWQWRNILGMDSFPCNYVRSQIGKPSPAIQQKSICLWLLTILIAWKYILQFYICDKNNTDTYVIFSHIRNILNSESRAIFIYDYPLHEAEVPGVVISSKDASKVIHYAATAQNPISSITFGQTFTGWKPAPTVSVSSARGPSSSFPSILKPDVIAPGSLVLASWIPDLRADPNRAFYVCIQRFQYVIWDISCLLSY